MVVEVQDRKDNQETYVLPVIGKVKIMSDEFVGDRKILMKADLLFILLFGVSEVVKHTAKQFWSKGKRRTI